MTNFCRIVMWLDTKLVRSTKLSLAIEALYHGLAYIDDNLRQGVLVYIESERVNYDIPRVNMLTLEGLSSAYPFVRMTSRVAIDFFGMTETEKTNVDYLLPIEIQVCTSSADSVTGYQWQTVARFHEAHIFEAMDKLIDCLASPQYFVQCEECKRVSPVGFAACSCQQRLIHAA
ncbi:TPA: hypothetical protein ACX6QM_002842 [Photobacterium damselae]